MNKEFDSQNEIYNILIVDDDEFIRDAFKNALSIIPTYRVDVVSKPSEAIEYFEKVNYDVIFIDIILPEKSGIELATEIRARESNVSIVMFTGTPEYAQVIESLHLSVFDFLTKPIEVQKLLETTENAIQSKRKRQQLLNKKILIDEADILQDEIFKKQEQMDSMILEGQIGSNDIESMVQTLAAQRQEARTRLSIINDKIRTMIDKL